MFSANRFCSTEQKYARKYFKVFKKKKKKNFVPTNNICSNHSRDYNSVNQISFCRSYSDNMLPSERNYLYFVSTKMQCSWLCVLWRKFLLKHKVKAVVESLLCTMTMIQINQSQKRHLSLVIGDAIKHTSQNESVDYFSLKDVLLYL